MGWAESQLEPGEKVLMRTGLHPMAFSGAATLAGFIALVVTLLIRHNDLPLATDLQIALVGGLVALLGALPAIMRWAGTDIVLTDRRVLANAGGMRRRRIAASLDRAVIEQEGGLTGRLLNHGTLTVATADGSANSIGHVARARDLVDLAQGQARRMPRRGAGRG